ncbi:MAG: hypothetical protein HY892_16990, partial [Deltaproteobacteria bacterium]|nr:hypothetical protein [Deltaproteobacteria bacterium]
MATFFKRQNSGEACKPLPGMDAEQTAQYRHFRALLDRNRTALTLTADLEQTYYNNRPFTIQLVERKCDRLFTEVDGMVQSLKEMSGREHGLLSAKLRSLRRFARYELAADKHITTESLTLPLSQIEAHLAKDVGAKAANLALMQRDLALPTPLGFAVTTTAYWMFLHETHLDAEIDEALEQMAADDPSALEATGRKIRSRILETPLPAPIRTALDEAALGLAGEASAVLRLAVRSSAVGEDSEISFAGQYTSVLNVPIG